LDAPNCSGSWRPAARNSTRPFVEEIDRLSGTGMGWGEIGAALGVSRQATRQAAIRRRVEPLRQQR
jgi:hypothetical protein